MLIVVDFAVTFVVVFVVFVSTALAVNCVMFVPKVVVVEVRVIIAASCGKMTTLNLWMGAERLFAAKLEKIRCKNASA